MNPQDIQRRSILGAGLLAMTASTAAKQLDDKGNVRKTFVLIHGALGGP